MSVQKKKLANLADDLLVVFLSEGRSSTTYRKRASNRSKRRLKNLEGIKDALIE
jgi:hypothetical protein